jgi:hypothetical protein
MIVEVACVRLESKDLHSLHDAPYEKRQASLRFTLTRGIRILSRVSKSSFQLLEDIKDPSLVYYIGRWRSLAEYTSFRASAERKELVNALRCCEASLDWHEISETEYSHPRNITCTLLHRPTDIFSSLLVAIARCHTGDSWKNGGGAEIEWILSSTRRHPVHKALIGKVPLMVFGKDVTTSPETGGHVSDSTRTIIGEWRTDEPKDVLEGDGCQVRCSSVDLRIASPIHLR